MSNEYFHAPLILELKFLKLFSIIWQPKINKKIRRTKGETGRETTKDR